MIMTTRPLTKNPEPRPRRAGLAEELRTSIARLSRRLRAQGNSRLSVTQFAALAALVRHESMTPRELADHEKVQPPSMTRVVAFLEEQGLVTRMPHPTDRRQVVLTPTEQGRRLVQEERRAKRAWLDVQLATLTPEERAILKQAAPILERLSQA
jgi:DNA-binding MarR family transcriptional regulator